MPKNLTDVDEFTSPITVPVGTDPRTAASVELPIQQLSNRTAHIKKYIQSDEWVYPTPKARSALLPIFDALAYDSATGAASTIGISLDAGLAVSHIVVATGDRASIPVRLRTGCVITSVDLVFEQDTDPGKCWLRKTAPSFSVPGDVTVTDLGVEPLPPLGILKRSILGLSAAVDSASEVIWVDLEAGTSGPLDVYAVRVNYTDPGPRNF